MNQTTLTSDLLDDLDLLLDQIAELSHLDCNAAADLLSYELEREGVGHTRMCGSVVQARSGETVFPHCWIELPNGGILDVRLQKYFPYADDVPHGMFWETEAYRYTGAAAFNERIPEELIKEIAS
ncbi:hypothetical protein [Marinobacter sp. F3R08]|uniref:hypothetical protein n=1 Tax=Marinobacter sp. F3R08 TaxID=2841559 RepID=UPI001C0932D9|nr:hypothetical protein [Marinobacter sp. F3R08]MBU2952219.1 hypothetical protein [Marinobacter sp. F3R08]